MRAQVHAARPARTRCARLYRCVERCAEPQQPGTPCQDFRLPVFRVGVFPLEAPFRLPFDDDLEDEDDDDDRPRFPDDDEPDLEL